MDLKVSDFAHDSSAGIFTVVVGDKRLRSKNPFSLFSSVLGFYHPKDRQKVAQNLTPVVEQWNMCLSPSLIDAANHSTTKEMSDSFYGTVSLVCPTEVDKYETKYIRDQTKQYTQREVVTMLTKLECKDKVLLGKVGMQTNVNPETGALTELGVKKIMNMTKEERNEVEDAFTSATIQNPCGTSNSCMGILDSVIQVQTESVQNVLQKARKSEKMQKITMIITISCVILVLIAIGVVVGVFKSKARRVTVTTVGDEENAVSPPVLTSTSPLMDAPVTEIELPPDVELNLSPLKLE